MLLIGKLKLNNSEEFIKENLQPSDNNIYETIKVDTSIYSVTPDLDESFTDTPVYIITKLK